ncbi:MAG: sulfotransferase [Desulfobacterales bacterium]|nr:sulfotransferase [Desulfobacterales bacterium]
MEKKDTKVISDLKEVQPLFICLGVRKAATTWLHRQLEAHPEIACTITKEIGYWTSNYNKGPGWYLDQFPKGNYQAFAEVTPHYLNENALSRMASDISDIRFILVLRDPFDRVWSEYLNMVRNGSRQKLSTAIIENPKLINHSLYAKALKTYLKFFSMDQLLILFFEEIKEDSISVLRKLYEFVGVNKDFVSDDFQKEVNKGRNYSVTDHMLKNIQLVTKYCGLRRKHLVGFGLDKKLEHLYTCLARKNPPPKMNEDDRTLLEKYLNQDIHELGNIINKNMYSWLQK